MKDIGFHPAPQWLTKEYFGPILRTYKKDATIRVQEFHLKPATAKGENYASIMTRIKVVYTSDSSKDIQVGSYIAKTSYEDDPDAAIIINPYKPYETEMLMYEKVLPKLTELLRNIPGAENDKIFPDTVHVDYEHSAIIFDDLAVEQFVLADRLRGLDIEHTKLALNKLAKMHAAAAVFHEKSPSILPQLDHGLFNRHTNGLEHFFQHCMEVCAKFAGEHPKLGQYYKDKLTKLLPHVMEYGARVFDPHPGHFITLNHGDFWTNNMMFRYCHNGNKNGAKRINDLILIDFQYVCWSSPAVDLHYFLNTSLEVDIRVQHDELVQYYYQILTKTLRELNYNGEVPSLREFVMQIEKGKFYAVIASTACQAIMLNDKTDDADFNALAGNTERSRKFRELLYTNKKLQNILEKLLPYFDRKGLLDLQ